MSGWIWLLVPGTPLLFAGLLPLARDRLAPWLWLSCVPALAVAVYSAARPVESFVLQSVWPGAQLGAPDLLSQALLGFSAFLWGCAGVYAATSQARHPRRLRFHGFWLLCLCGNLLLIIARDGTTFYVGFTAMSLAAYGLVVHLGGPRPRQAGRLYLQLAVLGEMLLYAALMLRIHEAGGSADFAVWAETPVGTGTAVLALIGLGIKAGFWPLHVWLPLAHPAAPAAASAVLSGAMLKAGILGVWRFLPVEDPLLQSWAPLALATGLFGAFYAVLVGFVQSQAKAVLAYSSVSQMGYLLVIIALAWSQPQASDAWATLLALYAVHHGLAKGALFMAAGLAAHYPLRRWFWLVLVIPAGAVAGLPLTSGGAVKTLLKYQAKGTLLEPWLALLSLGALATALLVGRALWLMARSQQELRREAKSRAPALMLLPWVLLCLLPSVLLCVWPPMREALFLSLGSTWKLLWPPLVASMVLGGLLLAGWRRPRWLDRWPNPSRLVAFQVHRCLRLLANKPPLPQSFDMRSWRGWERRWNRLCQRDAVVMSVFVLLLLVLLAR